MISPELIRRYPFFSGFNIDQINTLAMNTEEVNEEAGHFFIHGGEEISHLYFILDGNVEVLLELAELGENVTISTLGPTDVFGWGALVPPHAALAGVRAITPCNLLAIDCENLRPLFDEDPKFGYVMMTKAAQICRDRIAAMNMELLPFHLETSK